jgi:hypothetical protein
MESRDMVGHLESRFSALFQRKAGIHLPRRQIVVSLIILLPTSHQIPCEWIWGVFVGSPLHARQVSVWLCSSLEVITLFWARISVSPTVDCHFPMNYSFSYLPSYNIRCLTMNSGGLLLSRDRIGRKRLNQLSRHATKRIKVSNQ